MDGEQKMWVSMVLVIGALLAFLLVNAMPSCNDSQEIRSKVIQKCLEAGKSPLECEQIHL